MMFINRPIAESRQLWYQSQGLREGVIRGKPTSYPVSSEISNPCEISDLLFLVSYFDSQSKGIRFGDCFYDVCCVNSNVLVTCQIPTSYSTGIN